MKPIFLSFLLTSIASAGLAYHQPTYGDSLSSADTQGFPIHTAAQNQNSTSVLRLATVRPTDMPLPRPGQKTVPLFAAVKPADMPLPRPGQKTVPLFAAVKPADMPLPRPGQKTVPLLKFA